MSKQEYGNFTFHEVAMVSAIISDHLTKRLYDDMGLTYLEVVNKIANWAIEFTEKHMTTSWEKLIENGLKTESKTLRDKGVTDIMCWDDAVVDFALKKFEEIQ